jgi:hypothetical protein
MSGLVRVGKQNCRKLKRCISAAEVSSTLLNRPKRGYQQSDPPRAHRRLSIRSEFRALEELLHCQERITWSYGQKLVTA